MSFFIDNATVEQNLQHKAWNTGLTNVVVSATTLALTLASTTTQVFTGSVAGQIVKMPDATTFAQPGQRYCIHNDSTQLITVQDNAAAPLLTINAGQRAYMVCSGTGSAAGTWTWLIASKFTTGIEQFTTTYPGTGLSVNYDGGNANFDGQTYVIPGGSITLGASITNGFIFVDPVSHTVSSGASAPDGCVELYQFTTSSSAVTALVDIRQDVMAEDVWGVLSDISPLVYNSSKAAGILNKYARADHNHGMNVPLFKAGSIAAGSFTGNPKTATVTFTTPFPSVPRVLITGTTDGRSWAVTSTTVNGFTVSAQANQAITGDVNWVAHLAGESA
jgi:hypothetical protein